MVYHPAVAGNSDCAKIAALCFGGIDSELLPLQYKAARRPRRPSAVTETPSQIVPSETPTQAIPTTTPNLCTCATISAAFPCYGPNRPITRAQAIKLVLIAAALPTLSPAPPNWCGCSGGAFCAYIYVAYYYHIINGYADCVFRPNDPIRRGEMAQIIYKAMAVTLPP